MKALIQDKTIVLVGIVILMTAFFLSACATATALPASQDGVFPEEANTAVTPSDESEIIQDEISPLNPLPDEPSGATPQPEPVLRATPRLELHATDPSGVTLAAGKPQLIEFFAFW
jgi:hypothetical protein